MVKPLGSDLFRGVERHEPALRLLAARPERTLGQTGRHGALTRGKVASGQRIVQVAHRVRELLARQLALELPFFPTLRRGVAPFLLGVRAAAGRELNRGGRKGGQCETLYAWGE
jgi:hypothetical protein